MYCQSRNTEVHYTVISRVMGFPPEVFDVTEQVFFFPLFDVPARGDEELVDDRETRQPGGGFENTVGCVQGKDHERCRSIFHQPLVCWRITGSG